MSINRRGFLPAGPKALTVGVGQQFATIQEAMASAAHMADFDLPDIEIHAGTYSGVLVDRPFFMYVPEHVEGDIIIENSTWTVNACVEYRRFPWIH